MIQTEQRAQSPWGAGGRWLLVTDVDGTLAGDDDALARFTAVRECASHLIVVLNSSRPIASVMRSVRGWPVRFRPDAVIGAMGTEVLIGDEPDVSWSQRFGGWDRAVIDRIMLGLGFEPHADEFQTPLKASYTVDAANRGRVIEAIDSSGQPSRVVCSGRTDLDVLPAGADKAAATGHVCRRFGIDRDRLIVAGDSANDLAMFRTADRGIIVGNARRELRDAADASGAFVAVGTHADGLIEGLRHYGVIAAARDRGGV